MTEEMSKCPVCGNQMHYVEQYQQWYCYTCGRYYQPQPLPSYPTVEQTPFQQARYLSDKSELPSEQPQQYAPNYTYVPSPENYQIHNSARQQTPISNSCVLEWIGLLITIPVVIYFILGFLDVILYGPMFLPSTLSMIIVCGIGAVGYALYDTGKEKCASSK